MTEERKQQLLAYMRVDVKAVDENELVLIDTLYDAAVAYMEQAGVGTPDGGTPRAAQYDLLVNALVLDSYDRRDMTIAAATVSDNPAFRRIMVQLKLTEPSLDNAKGTGLDA